MVYVCQGADKKMIIIQGRRALQANAQTGSNMLRQDIDVIQDFNVVRDKSDRFHPRRTALG